MDVYFFLPLKAYYSKHQYPFSYQTVQPTKFACCEESIRHIMAWTVLLASATLVKEELQPITGQCVWFMLVWHMSRLKYAYLRKGVLAAVIISY